MNHLSRVDLPSRNELYGRVNIQKACWVDQRACVTFQVPVIPLSFKKPTNLSLKST